MSRYPGRAFLPAALAALLCAAAQAKPKNPDTLTYASNGDVDSLDPAWAYDTMSHNIIANVYEYLLAFKGSSLSEFEGRLASAVPSKANGLLSKDGLRYAFPIRKGVTFHDGSPLTPEDVRYSLLRFMLQDRDGGPASLLLEPLLGVLSTRDSAGRPRAGLFAEAEKAVRVEGEKVVLRLKRPHAPFLAVLANFGAIVPKAWCARNGDWDGSEASWTRYSNPRKEDAPLHEKANGTGPFKLARWDKKSKELLLERFEGYWRGPARLRRVLTKTIDEFATRKLMLEAGDADVIYAPQMLFPQVRDMAGVEVIDGLENLERSPILFFTFRLNPVGNPNTGSGRLDGNGIPPDFLSDKDIRKAFAYCIDYGAYLRDVLRGKGRQAGGLIPKGLTGYNPRQKTYRLDLAKAREHFEKAWGARVWEKGFKLTVLFNSGSQPAQTICNMIKRNVESLNPKFKIDVRSVQWSSYLEQTQARKIPVFVGAWQADYPDAHNFAYPLMHSSGYFPQKQGYANAEADRVIEAAVSTLDAAARARLYGRLLEIAYEDVPHVQITEGVRYRTQRRWVKGWTFSPIFPDSPYGSYYYDLYKEDPS